jgi:hypothetical protein
MSTGGWLVRTEPNPAQARAVPPTTAAEVIKKRRRVIFAGIFTLSCGEAQQG